MESKELKNLGWMNGWKRKPIEVIKCDHDWKSGKEVYHNGRGYTKVTCHKCGYYYEIDSSD